MKRLLFLASLLVASLSFGAEKSIIDYAPDSVPSGGWVVGTNVGLPGGYPDTSGWTVVTPTVDTTGATDSSAAIIAAIAAAGTGGTIIELPATPGGFLLIDFQLYVNGKRNVLIRGAVDGDGLPATFARTGVGTGALVVMTGGDRVNAYSAISGLTKGSTSITLSSGGGASYTTGDLIRLDITNDTSIPAIDVTGGDPATRKQITRVTNVVGDVLTIFPALYDDYTIGASVSRYSVRNEWCGVENISCDMENSDGDSSQFQIIGGSYACWVKNVFVQNVHKRAFLFQDSLFLQVRRCRADYSDNYPLPSGGGMTVEYTSGSLFDDNILYEQFPGFEVNFGCSGNVFAFNFGDKNGGSGAKGITSNHGAHNFMNLYEGNCFASVQSDGYFGSNSRDSYYRNFFRGVDNGQGVGVFTINRFGREIAVYGSILSSAPGGTGNPNLGNSVFVGTATSNNWKDYGISKAGLTGVLTSKASASQGVVTFDAPSGGVGGIGQLSDGVHGDLVVPAQSLAIRSQGAFIYWSGGVRQRVQVVANTGVDVSARTVAFEDWPGLTTGNALPDPGTAVTVWTGISGFQELDALVADTMRLTSNYYLNTGNIPAEQSIGADTLAPSVAYATFPGNRPDWWDIAQFPIFPPYDSTAPIPSSANIPAGQRFLEQTPPELNSAAIATSGNLVSLTINKNVTAGAGGTTGVTLTASAGAVTLTYAGTVGSLLNYSTSRPITDAELVTVSYLQPGNGWEDSNGNDLPSFTARAVTNNSGLTSGAEFQYTTLPENAADPIPYDLSNDVDSYYPIVFTKSGFLPSLAVQISTSLSNGIGCKIAIYNSSLALMSSGTTTFDTGTVTRFISADLVEAQYVVAGQTYWLSVKFNSNNDPLILLARGQPSGSSYYNFGPSYASWPPSNITLAFANTDVLCIRARLIPDAVTTTATVSNLNVGTIRLAP